MFRACYMYVDKLMYLYIGHVDKTACYSCVSFIVIKCIMLLCTIIDLKLRATLHVPVHYKIGVRCTFRGHEMYCIVMTRRANTIFSQFSRPRNEFTRVCAFPHVILGYKSVAVSVMFHKRDYVVLLFHL